MLHQLPPSGIAMRVSCAGNLDAHDTRLAGLIRAAATALRAGIGGFTILPPVSDCRASDATTPRRRGMVASCRHVPSGEIPPTIVGACRDRQLMSLQFDFLAHAILGLGAAHVTQNNPGVDYTPSALQHRLTAIKRVNQEFDKPKRTTREADALMAAVLCLIAQSSLFDNSDSMIEYLTMSRGANLVLNQLLPNIGESIFCDIHIDAHLDKIRDMTSEQPMDLELLGHFQDSVLALMTLCSGPNEMKYIDCLIRCSTALRISGTNGELALMHRNKFALISYLSADTGPLQRGVNSSPSG